MDDLHNADAIFVSTHSQGSVVSTHLLDRLIRDRHIRTSKNAASEPISDLGVNMVPLPPQRVCCLALCGIHLGPLRYLNSSSLLQPFQVWAIFTHYHCGHWSFFDVVLWYGCQRAVWIPGNLSSPMYIFSSQLWLEHREWCFQGVCSGAPECSSQWGELYSRRFLSMAYNDHHRPRWFMLHLWTIRSFPYIQDCLRLPLIHWFYEPFTSMAMHTSEFWMLGICCYPLNWAGISCSSSDFLTNLLVLLLRVLNCGLSDSGLLAHLSEVTAGSLNGIGHSTAYEELSTFSYAVCYLSFITISSFSQSGSELSFPHEQRFWGSSGINNRTFQCVQWNERLWGLLWSSFVPTLTIYLPLQIPWALRDLIADERVTHYFSQEITQLRDAFRDWHPKTTILRDIKRKLQPIQRLPTTSTPGTANSASKLWCGFYLTVQLIYLSLSSLFIPSYKDSWPCICIHIH